MIISAASCACLAVSATTQHTGSPTIFTASFRSAPFGGRNMGEPSGFWRGTAQGMLPRPDAA